MSLITDPTRVEHEMAKDKTPAHAETARALLSRIESCSKATVGRNEAVRILLAALTAAHAQGWAEGAAVVEAAIAWRKEMVSLRIDSFAMAEADYELSIAVEKYLAAVDAAAARSDDFAERNQP